MTRKLNPIDAIAEGLCAAWQNDPTGWTPEDIAADARRTNEDDGFTIYSNGGMGSVLRTENIHLTERELSEAVTRTCDLLEHYPRG